jgi:hypothetical protein
VLVSFAALPRPLQLLVLRRSAVRKSGFTSKQVSRFIVRPAGLRLCSSKLDWKKSPQRLNLRDGDGLAGEGEACFTAGEGDGDGDAGGLGLGLAGGLGLRLGLAGGLGKGLREGVGPVMTLPVTHNTCRSITDSRD